MDPGLWDGLNVILCNTPPEWVLQPASAGKNVRQTAHWQQCCEDQSFHAAFRRELPNRSGIEAEHILRVLRQLPGNDSGVFGLMLSAAREYLCLDGTQARCRHEKMLEWRLFTQQTGQLPFICAFLAWKDLHIGFCRTDFSFSPYAKTDYLRLRNLLAKGMAENHFHLGAGAPAASLSWLSLMNRIRSRQKGDGFGNARLKYALAHAYGDYDTADSGALDSAPVERLHRLVCVAALLRALLWNYLVHGSAFDADLREGECLLDRLVSTRSNPAIPLYSYVDKAQSWIDSLRLLSGSKLDYAQQAAGSDSAAYDIFSGEHCFLYRMFRLVWEEPKAAQRFGDWFYAYLLIWFRFRRELSQCNEVYGLDNFIQYQNRKSFLLDKPFKDEQARVAARCVLDNPAIRSLEARIVLPVKNTASALSGYVQIIPEPRRGPEGGRMPRAAGPIGEKSRDERMFFVVHLQKRRDNGSPENRGLPGDKHLLCVPFRHKEHRDKNIWPLIQTLVNMFRSGDGNAALIYGLDACSQEIGCRAEVFAPAFRYARERAVPTGTALGTGFSHSLRLTYHVGEDFLDVADGLRAIEEAVLFLELRAGDRLGHALALGIDPESWYKKRNGNLFLPAQDILDNTVWLLRRLRKMNYSDGALMEFLNDTYDALCGKIYGERYTMVAYARAWRLRGDDPAYYFTGTPSSPDWIFRISQDRELCRWREQERDVRDLYWRYHYDPGVRERGNECLSYQVPPGYGAAVRAAQRELRREIVYRRIGIETCPSSNYLIGRFGAYEQHPIVQFNHTYLSGAEEEPGLFVSINTDDQGIFDTDLENEYALMACALESSGGSDENTPEQVLRWVDYIRQMGLEQSFRYVAADFGAG